MINTYRVIMGKVDSKNDEVDNLSKKKVKVNWKKESEKMQGIKIQQQMNVFHEFTSILSTAKERISKSEYKEKCNSVVNGHLLTNGTGTTGHTYGRK